MLQLPSKPTAPQLPVIMNSMECMMTPVCGRITVFGNQVKSISGNYMLRERGDFDILISERCLSGRKGRSRKPLSRKAPRVRIPASPNYISQPNVHCSVNGLYIALREKVHLSMVGASRFERPTTCTPSKCATRLRHAPNLKNDNYRHRQIK